jgi:hypothetical protein
VAEAVRAPASKHESLSSNPSTIQKKKKKSGVGRMGQFLNKFSVWCLFLASLQFPEGMLDGKDSKPGAWKCPKVACNVGGRV